MTAASAGTTTRLALGLVGAILLANLASVAVAARSLHASIVQQGQETEALTQRLLAEEHTGALSDVEALLLQARERAAADADRAMRVLGLSEVVSSVFGIGLGLILLRAMRRLQAKERELEHTVAQLRTTNGDLDAFAGRVAHDLRNALAPQRLAAGMLHRIDRQACDVEKVAGILDRSSTRMSKMIDALLQYARAQAPESGDRAEVSTAVAGALEEAASLAREVSAELRSDVAPAWIAGAPGGLHVLVSNLVNNALKFLGAAPERRVIVRGRVEGEHYVLQIADTGPGITGDAMVHLFEPFFRAEGVQAEGFGIGLATVRRAVDAMGGGIRVDSIPGRGATFTVWLPLAVPPDQPPASSDAASARGLLGPNADGAWSHP